MVVVAYHHEQSKFAGRRVTWFLDNSSALYVYAKGTSGNRWLEHTTQVFHLQSFRDKVRVWFEFVASHQNWVDGISRDLNLDHWSRSHGFSTRLVSVPISLRCADLKDFLPRGTAETAD